MNFLEKIVKTSALSYEQIDLDPESQTYVSVIVKNGKAYLTDIHHLFEEITAEELVNNYCGCLLVNNIDCPGYTEGNFTTNRGYDFESILKCKQEDFGTIYYETLLKFSNLCKAIATESIKTDKIFFIEMYYAEDCVNYYIEGEKEYDMLELIDKLLSESELNENTEKYMFKIIEKLQK